MIRVTSLLQSCKFRVLRCGPAAAVTKVASRGHMCVAEPFRSAEAGTCHSGGRLATTMCNCLAVVL